MPQNSNFQLPLGHRFFPKNGSYGYGTKSRWGHHRVHLGANGVPLGKKNGSKPQKITMPQNSRIFDYPAVIVFLQKMEVMVMVPNHGGDPLGSILGPMGSHWVKKMGQNCKKLPCPKIRFFAKNGSYGYGAKSRSWGQWGPIGSKKWVKTVKNYHAPKFEFSITLRSSIFCKKWKLRLWRQITVGTP